MGDGGDVAPGDGVEAVDELAVAGGVHTGEVVDEGFEVVDGDGSEPTETTIDQGIEISICDGCGGGG